MQKKRNQTVEILRKEMNRRESHRRERNGERSIGVLDRGVGRTDLSSVNEKLVLNYIRQTRGVPRVSIADDLKLSRATVGSLINSLKQKDLVKDGDLVPSGGKPATNVYFNASAAYILGVDVGRRHLGMVLTDLEGEKPANIEPRKVDFDTTVGAKDGLVQLAYELQNYLNTYQVVWDDVLGIGIGIPGTLDRDLQKLVKPPRMPGWDGVEIPKGLRRQLPKSTNPLPIYVDNDANMGVLGESRYGAGKDVTNLVYIKIGSGIGAGLILEGHLYRGRGTAGELGHMILLGEQKDLRLECPGCGNCCLEMLASRYSLLRETGHSDNPGAIHELADLARSGDETSRAAFERAGEYIGKAVANLINLFNPDRILLGGGVMDIAKDLLLPVITKHAQACVPAATGTDIRMGTLGRQAIARGAVATVIAAAFGTQTILEAAFGTPSTAALGLVAMR